METPPQTRPRGSPRLNLSRPPRASPPSPVLTSGREDPLQLPSAAGGARRRLIQLTERPHTWAMSAATASSPWICSYNLQRKHEARPPVTTGTIPPVPRTSALGTAAESLPPQRSPELGKEGTIQEGGHLQTKASEEPDLTAS